ncbi:MAG: type II secretion system inner membrane protein GspF [Deltaproteobacteria bacterium]|nr:MAG: type II secretion system inner membrane protein GspF [Deltaproteobacteria bacterium]
MPVFEYKGINDRGKNVKGVIDADTLRAARARLRKEGIFTTDLAEGKASPGRRLISREVSFSSLFTRIKSQDIALLTRQLATLTAAGLPLIESLSALVDQVDNIRLKNVLTEVRDKVNEGSSLADAMRQSPRIFSELYTNMIGAGETSGALDVVMLRLADYIEDRLRLRNRIFAALAYPVLMLIVMTGVIILLMTFVIPKVTLIFDDMGQSVPVYTRALISFSNFTKDYWWIILMVGLLLGFGVRRYLRSPGGRKRFDTSILRVPVIGKLFRMVAISRFTKTLSTLLSGGIPILKSMDIVKNVVNNVPLAQAVEDARENISEGATIAEPLRRSKIFPPIVIHMVSVGERSGELEDMLMKVSESFDNEVETTVTGLTSLLEPLIIIFMGGIVFFIMISILLPIFQMNQLIR